ncbi:MAG: hypothetical protein K2I60_00730, partial [Oscillospiraceae bacterium]|nr:hypothetical protein [Oscillospiraceae bacterium]
MDRLSINDIIKAVSGIGKNIKALADWIINRDGAGNRRCESLFYQAWADKRKQGEQIRGKNG